MLVFLAEILTQAMMWWQLQTNLFWHLGKNRCILRQLRYQTLTMSLTQILGMFCSCWQIPSGAGSWGSAGS